MINEINNKLKTFKENKYKIKLIYKKLILIYLLNYISNLNFL